VHRFGEIFGQKFDALAFQSEENVNEGKAWMIGFKYSFVDLRGRTVIGIGSRFDKKTN
jgi:hypothetical protein